MSDLKQEKRKQIPPRQIAGLFKFACLLTLIITIIFSVLIHIPIIQRSILNSVFYYKGNDLGFMLHTESFKVNFFSGHIQAKNLLIIPARLDSAARLEIKLFDLNIDVPALINNSFAIQNLTVNDLMLTMDQNENGTVSFPWNLNKTKKTKTTRQNTNESERPFLFIADHIDFTNSSLKIVNKDKTILFANGIDIAGNMDFRAMKMDADFIVKEAGWLKPEIGQEILLTRPLNLNAQRHGGPININMNLGIDEFPLEMIGQFVPEAMPLQYQFRITGKGKPENLLTHLGLPEISIPFLDLELLLESTETSIPQMHLSASSKNVQISKQQFETVNLSGDMDDKLLTIDLLAMDKSGKIHLSGEKQSNTEIWNQKVQLSRFQLDTLKPWLPEMLDLQGIVNGEINICGKIDEWQKARANGHLVFSQAESREIKTTNITDTFRPEGEIDIQLKDEHLLISNLSLEDHSHKIDLSGNWNSKTNQWSTAIKINTSDLSFLEFLSNVHATGSVELNGEFANSVQGQFDTKNMPGFLDNIEGNLNAELIDVSVGGQASVSSKLSATLLNNEFKAEIEKLNWNDLTLSGLIHGDLLPTSDKKQTVTASIDKITWQENTMPSIEIAWHQENTGQIISLHSDANDLTADFSEDNKSNWTGHIDFRNFKLDYLDPFLPKPWDDITGFLTTTINFQKTSSDISEASNSIIVESMLGNLSISILDRTISSSHPSHILFKNNKLKFNNLVLTGDDGSRIAVNGMWSIDDSINSDLQFQASVPDLAGWKYPGINSEYTGSVSSNLHLEGNWPNILPSGTFSATGISISGISVSEINAKFVEASSAQEIAVELAVAELQAGDAGAIINTHGNLRCKNWSESMDMLLVHTELTEFAGEIGHLKYSADLPVIIELSEGIISIPSFRISGPDLLMEISGILPISTTQTDIDRGMDISLHTDLAPFSALTPQIGDVTGSLLVEIQVNGIVTDPEATGKVVIQDVNWDSSMIPEPIEHLSGMIDIGEKEINLKNFSTEFAGGVVELTGGITRKNQNLDMVDIVLRARRIDMDYSTDLRIQGGSELWLRGPWDKVSMGGTITIQEALYTPELDLINLLTSMPEQRLIISEDNENESEDENIIYKNGIPLNFTIITQNDMRIENSNMELTLESHLQVVGTTKLPGVLGSINCNYGYIDLLLHEFKISSGTITFSQPYDLNPVLDIISTTQIKDEVITLQISGKADKPNMLLSSETGKSHAEIMKMLLGSETLGSSDDFLTMAKDYAKQAAALAAAEAISARTGIIIVPFPETLEGEDLLLGFGRKFGKRWTVMYYIGEKTDKNAAIEVKFNVNPKSKILFRQNQDGSLTGGFRYRETFN